MVDGTRTSDVPAELRPGATAAILARAAFFRRRDDRHEIGRQFARIDADSNKGAGRWDAGAAAQRRPAARRRRAGEARCVRVRVKASSLCISSFYACGAGAFIARACSRRASALSGFPPAPPAPTLYRRSCRHARRRLLQAADFATHRGFPFLCRRRRRLVLATRARFPPRLERTHREPGRLDLLAQHFAERSSTPSSVMTAENSGLSSTVGEAHRRRRRGGRRRTSARRPPLVRARSP